MLNADFLVDVNKVAKQCKKTGDFIMFKCDAGNLLVTSLFVLNLTSEQFWKVQCKLEIPERGIWYRQGKDALERSEREESIEKIEENYNEWLTRDSKKISYTGLNLFYQYALYVDDYGHYTAIDDGKKEMIKTTAGNVRRAGNLVIIDKCHVIAAAKDSVWQENQYLVKED